MLNLSHQVIWSKTILETFIKEANLSKEDEWIMRTRVAGWSRVKQCEELHISMSALDQRIRRLKKRYDVAQKHNPLLQPRKFSAKELWMDTH